MNTVIIITDYEEIKLKMQENLVLLRGSDRLLSVNYDNAPDVLYDIRPDIVILHEHERREKTIGIIKYLKERRIFSNSNIVLLANVYDKDFILEAYDEGINDYITLQSEPSEILIRVINSIKMSGMKSKAKRFEKILEFYNIIDISSEFYSTKFENEIFSTELLRENYENGSYMMLSPTENCKKDFSTYKMNTILKNVLRINDIVSGPSGAKYGILLQDDIEGAIKVFEKIKAELIDKKYDLRAGITAIDSNKFDEIKKKTISALNSAILSDKEYVIYSAEGSSSENWLDFPEDKDKTYKFYKKAFGQKIENVIAPVFFRLQKTYEEKIGDADIEQFTDEQQSVFRIINGKNESRLTMIYPGYSKLVITITHTGFDSPENRTITIPLKEITQAKIDEIVESFINEFMGIYRHI